MLAMPLAISHFCRLTKAIDCKNTTLIKRIDAFERWCYSRVLNI